MNTYPIYKAIVNIDDETAMYAVSLVDAPAVERNFLAFSKEKEVLKFNIENEEQRIVTGLIMSCNTPILRMTSDGERYYILFDEENIKIMTRKFLKMGYNNNVDLEHDFNYIDGVELMELYIKNTDRGINPKGFEDVNNGSLFGTYYIKSDEVWEQIKSGIFKGFSIEIVCEIEISENEEEQEFKEVEELVKKIIKKIRK